MSIEVKLNNALLKKVDNISSKLKIGRDEFIAKALKKYLHLEEMASVREELKGLARKKGFKSENDIFERIS